MALSDADVTRLNQQLAADPQWQQLVAAANAEQAQFGSGTVNPIAAMEGKTPATAAILAYYKSHNIPLGPNSGNNAIVQPDGTIKLNHPYKTFAKDAAISAGIAAGGAAASGALAGGGAASAGAGAGGSAAGAGDLAAMEPGAELAGGAGGGAAATGGATAAGTGFGAALKAALPQIIGAGAAVGGAAIAAKGNTDAAKIAAAQQQSALDQAKLIYQQQRADLSPYRQIGASALGPLSFGLGIAAPTPTQGPFDTSTGPQGTTVGMPTATGPIVAAGAKDAQGNPLPNAGQNQVIPNPPTPAQTMGTLSTVGGGGTVRIQDPATGLVHLVPQGQAAAAQQAGGRLV